MLRQTPDRLVYGPSQLEKKLVVIVRRVELGRKGRTSGEEAVFGQDGDGIGDKDQGVKELPQTEEEHLDGRKRSGQEAEGRYDGERKTGRRRCDAGSTDGKKPHRLLFRVDKVRSCCGESFL